MYKKDQTIKTPANDTVIWRYIDLTRLVSLLSSRKLHMTRLDSFKDPWEGSWPFSAADLFSHHESNASRASMLDHLKRFRTVCYVNCWHASADESAALWSQYASENGVAIRSTVASVKRAIRAEPAAVNIGRVKYIDFLTDPSPPPSWTGAALLKRKSFAHEKEVRLIRHSPPDPDQGDVFDLMKPFLSVETDISLLVESVVVSPTSEEWFVDVVRDLCGEYGLNTEVTRSRLYDEANYWDQT